MENRAPQINRLLATRAVYDAIEQGDEARALSWLDSSYTNLSRDKCELCLRIEDAGVSSDKNLAHSSIPGGTDMLSAAARARMPKLVEALVPRCEVDRLDARDITPLRWAAESGCLESVQILLNAGAKPRQPSQFDCPLSAAILARHSEVALALLAKSTLEPGENTETPLMAASYSGLPEVIQSILSRFETHAERRDYAALRDVHGWTALTHLAVGPVIAEKVLDDTLKQLIPVSDVFACDNNGRTASDHATRHHRKDLAAKLSAAGFAQYEREELAHATREPSQVTRELKTPRRGLSL